MSELSKRISSLSPEKRELLLKRLEGKQSDNTKRSISTYTRESNNFLMSYAQEQLWLLSQLEEGIGAAYHIPQAYRLRGEVDAAALEKSFDEVIVRHEALRTRSVSREGQPYQQIVSPSPFKLPVVDLQTIPSETQETKLHQLLSKEVQRPFDLETEPLLRARLYRMKAKDHVLLVTVHHIVFDGWSMKIFWQELDALYKAHITGDDTSPLPSLPIQYVDYVQWQREQSKGGALIHHIEYWKKQLEGASPVLALPTDNPRSAVQTFRGATYNFTLSQALTEPLKALSRRESTTLFMTLLAGFKVLLHRYTSQTDIIVGTPIANRSRVELEGLIGFFVNTLVLRTDLSGNPTFRELLGRVRETALEAYDHQDVPFTQLVQALQPERDMSHNPLFQVMFALQNEPDFIPELPALEVEPVPIDRGAAQFDLSLLFSETEQGLVGTLEYNTDLFTEETISRMAGHLVRLFEGIATDPDHSIGILPLLTEAERYQILVEWNDTKINYPQDKCIHEMFEDQVKRTPEATAVIFEEQKLTYRELNERANQIAHYLRKLGVGPEVLVGVCIERSIEMVVGILGILKVGGAYVPLDPTYPQERLAFMLMDTEAPVIVTQEHLQTRLPKGHQAKPVLLDTEWEKIAGESRANPQNVAISQNLAYVIYTSGSTGEPKGVAITHQNAGALLHWAASIFTLEELKGVLAATSICFDLSVYELFLTLCQGGTIILAQNALHLLTLPIRDSVTLINTVPSVMNELVQVNAIPDSVQTVNLAGEPLTKELVRQVYQRSKVQRVYNLYGPSEDTTYSTFVLVNQSDSNEPTIGQPIANTQVYIFDQYVQPVPIGVVGELYLGGDGVSRGYLNCFRQTAERYLPNLFSHKPGTCVYRTGDLARYLPDGSIEFIGRLDSQVKVRGFRIELGEIEAVLTQHPTVQEAAIMIRNRSDVKQIVAYVVLYKQIDNATSELHEFLSAKLPNYMLPNDYVILDKLPLTRNGKVSYSQLSELKYSLPVNDKMNVPPRDSLEFKLRTIWEEILNIKDISVQDNFFALGGDSLLASRLISKINQVLKKNISVRSLFTNATIERLATTFRDSKGTVTESWSPIVPLQHQGDKLPFFCVHPKGGKAFSYINLAYNLGSRQPVYGLEAKGVDGRQRPHSSVTEMALCYVDAMRTTQPTGPYNIGGYSLGGTIAYEMAQQLIAQGEKVALLALFDTVTQYPPDTLEACSSLQMMTYFVKKHQLPLEPNFWEMDYVEQVAYVLAHGKASNALPPDFELIHLKRRFELEKVHGKAIVKYHPQPFPGKVTLFRIEGDDPYLGWDKLAEVKLYRLPIKEHTLMFNPENSQLVARELKKILNT